MIKTNTPRALSLFSLTLITVVSVDSIRNLPATALFGSQLIFFFILGALLFLIPCALVSAELSSGWPKQGGIYIWVKEAFGESFGFLAIWYQWIENVIWYPTILSFVASTLGYLIDPKLVNNKYFLITCILSAFWGATWINLRGMRSSALFSNLCAIAGLLIPMTLIIVLGVLWFSSGHPIQIHFSSSDVLPHWHDPNIWVSLTAIMLSFSGIEIATVHANDVVDPQRNFPKSLAYSSIIIITTLLLGALSIAIVLPVHDISLVAGIMQAFDAFFAGYHLSFLMPVIAIMLIFGGLGGLSNWIIAPTKGLLVAAQQEHFPSVFRQVNHHGAPTSLLVIQAILVSLLCSVFLFMPSINGSYWFLTALTSQVYMIMYIIMFVTGIYLRFKAPEQKRLFAIPGGKVGMLFVGILGIIGCCITLAVGFIPPDNINFGSASAYPWALTAGLVILSLPPFIFHRRKKKHLATQKNSLCNPTP